MTEKLLPKAKALIDDTIPNFIKKTYDILEEGKFPDVIDWNSEGTALIIKKPTEFCQKVLPLYFKHNNLTSFIRQLNMYNFHKRRTQDIDHIYCHELFQRGKKHLLKEIKRKNHEHFHCIQKTFDALELIQNGQDTPNIAQENILLKNLNREALVRVSTLDKRLKDLNYQNQTLWSQICNQNEREELLKSLLINLMKQFGLSSSQLPSLMKNNPQLLIPTDKSSKELLLKTIQSQNFINTSQEQTKLISDRLNTGDFLPVENNISDNRDSSLLSVNTIPFYQNFQGFNSEPESKIIQSNNQNSMSTSIKKENYVQGQPYHDWNLENEYLKTFITADQRLNNEYIDSHVKTKNPELLGKRHPEFEKQCKNPFEPQSRQHWEEFEDTSLFIKKETPDKDALMMDEDNPKLGIFKNFKSEKIDPNATVDLMNFN